MFWSTVTPVGYHQFFLRVSEGVQREEMGEEVVEALRRAVAARKGRKKKRVEKPAREDDGAEG